MSDVFDPDGSTAYPPAAPVNPPRRAFRRILLTFVGLVVVIVVAFVVLILWPNPTVPADQPNMTPVATGTNNDWLSFDDFVPGTAIATDSVDATTDEVDSHECTLAFLGRDATDTAIAFTAGHCRKEDSVIARTSPEQLIRTPTSNWESSQPVRPGPNRARSCRPVRMIGRTSR